MTQFSFHQFIFCLYETIQNFLSYHCFISFDSVAKYLFFPCHIVETAKTSVVLSTLNLLLIKWNPYCLFWRSPVYSNDISYRVNLRLASNLHLTGSFVDVIDFNYPVDLCYNLFLYFSSLNVCRKSNAYFCHRSSKQVSNRSTTVFVWSGQIFCISD